MDLKLGYLLPYGYLIVIGLLIFVSYTTSVCALYVVASLETGLNARYLILDLFGSIASCNEQKSLNCFQ